MKMNKTDNEIIELYNFARTKIQLDLVNLEDVKILKNDINPDYDYNVILNFGKSISRVDNKTVDGLIIVDISIIPIDKVESDLDIHVVYKGRFTSQDDTEDDMEQWVGIQIIPLLLPYARAFVTNLTIQMGHDPVIIPTMDVLEALKLNDFPEQMVGDHNDDNQ